MVTEQTIEVVSNIVDSAGDILKKYRKDNYTISFKDDNSPVTDIDKKIETYLKENLFNKFPDVGFLGEESKGTNMDKEFIWVCDPIDGTWSFINGEDTVAISLALLQNGVNVLSIVYNPVTEHFFLGTGHGKVSLNKTIVLPAINKSPLNKVIVNHQVSVKNMELLNKIYSLKADRLVGKIVSHGGSIAYNMSKVAEGVTGVFIWSGKGLNIWDIAAAVSLVEFAGGEVTDLNGQKLDLYSFPNFIVASTNKNNHRDFLEFINE